MAHFTALVPQDAKIANLFKRYLKMHSSFFKRGEEVESKSPCFFSKNTLMEHRPVGNIHGCILTDHLLFSSKFHLETDIVHYLKSLMEGRMIKKDS